MAPAINVLADAYEAAGYALSKMKIAQLFGLTIFRENAGDLGEDDGEGYSIDLTKGPFVADLEAGDRMEAVESKSPSTEFQAYWREMIGLALKALHIPLSFYVPGLSNYAEMRAHTLQWQAFIESRRDVLRQTLNNLVAWRLGMFINDGYLKLPATWTIGNLGWEWVAPTVPWLDPKAEIEASILAINAGITSPQRVCKERGEDAAEILAEIAQWNADREALELPPFDLKLPATAPQPAAQN